MDKAVVNDLANDPAYKDKGLTQDDFRILNPTNPKKPSGTTKSSYDRDITVQRRAQAGDWVPDPNAPSGFRKCKAGETAWVDVPAKDLENHYSNRFYEAANGKPAPDAATAKQFAKDHDQTCNGSPLERLLWPLQQGPEDRHEPAGPASSRTREQVGQAMGYKAHEWFEKADHSRGSDPVAAEGYMAEGMRQTSKQWDNQALKRGRGVEEAGHRRPCSFQAERGDGRVEEGGSRPAIARCRRGQTEETGVRFPARRRLPIR